MCTVTVVPLPDGFRLVANRDERRDRAEARAPRLHTIGARTAVFPLDPDGGGTWVGVNDAGVAAAVLNRTIDARVGRQARKTTRGRLVPLVLGHRSLRDALAAAGAIDPCAYNPFRLVIVDRTRVAVIASDGSAACVRAATLTSPALFTSSSLGDAFVEAPRRALFDRLVRDADDWLSGQSRFHRHRWSARPEISVTMSRDEAATVSRTAITVRRSRLCMSYSPVSGARRAQEAA